MNKTKPVVSLSLAAFMAFSAFMLILLIINSQAAQAASGPDFNTAGKSFVIESDASDAINNVAGNSSQPDSFERNFLRLGDGWNRQGDYPGGGDRFEACQDGQIVTLWVYAHNTIHTRHNHKVAADLDFQGSAIAQNTTLALELDNLNQPVYKSEHQISAIINADNALAKEDTATIHCGDQEIALVSSGLNQPAIYSWSDESLNRVNHEKAQEVFNSGYILSNPNNIFSGGSKIGYDGNLPACRYYAAYIEIQLKVVLKPTEVIPEPEPESEADSVSALEPQQPPEATVPIPSLGSSDGNDLNFSLLGLLAITGVSIAGALGRHWSFVRSRRR